MVISMNNTCICSKKVIDSTLGQLFEMILNKDGTYYDECRLCHKPIDIEIWKKHNNIKE